MTAPADPREALARVHRAEAKRCHDPEHGRWRWDEGQDPIHDALLMEEVDRELAALNDAGYTLAARQDEPSPALLLRRVIAVVDAASMVWRDPVPADAIDAIHDAKEWLAANPPQTREAEGAAPDGD